MKIQNLETVSCTTLLLPIGSLNKQRRRRRQRERQNKAIGLDWQNNNFARAPRFFVHFFAVTARLRRGTPGFHVFWRTWTQDDDFVFVFLNFDTVLWNSNPEKFANIWRITRAGISVNSLFKWRFRSRRRRCCLSTRTVTRTSKKKKTIGFISKTTTLHVHPAFLYISLPVFARLRRKHA